MHMLNPLYGWMNQNWKHKIEVEQSVYEMNPIWTDWNIDYPFQYFTRSLILSFIFFLLYRRHVQLFIGFSTLLNPCTVFASSWENSALKIIYSHKNE